MSDDHPLDEMRLTHHSCSMELTVRSHASHPLENHKTIRTLNGKTLKKYCILLDLKVHTLNGWHTCNTVPQCLCFEKAVHLRVELHNGNSNVFLKGFQMWKNQMAALESTSVHIGHKLESAKMRCILQVQRNVETGKSF